MQPVQKAAWHTTTVLGSEDLYQPLIISKFYFHKKDFIAEYKIIPKYRNIHEIDFKIKPNILPSG